MSDIGQYPLQSNVISSDQFLSYRSSSGTTGRIPFSVIQDTLVNTNPIQCIVVVQDESDLPPLSSGEHVLYPNTSYFFPCALTIQNRLRIISTTTELYGNGIGISNLTYSGTGYAVIADNTLSSFRMRFMQITSTQGDGLFFVGDGLDSGIFTNISIIQANFVCPNGIGINSENVDIFFATGSLLLAQTPIIFNGGNNGLCYAEACRLESTILSSLLDFTGTQFESILCNNLQFRGVAGTTAIVGDPDSINVTESGIFTGCLLQSGLLGLSGIQTSDVGYKFRSNVGISDSLTISMAYISAPALTTINPGIDLPILGTWSGVPENERVSVDPSGVVEFLNREQDKGEVSVILSATKAGAIQDYLFKVQTRLSGFDPWGDVEGAGIIAGIGASVSLVFGIEGIVQFTEGTQFRITAQGIFTGDDITVTTSQFVIR